MWLPQLSHRFALQQRPLLRRILSFAELLVTEKQNIVWRLTCKRGDSESRLSDYRRHLFLPIWVRMTFPRNPLKLREMFPSN